VLFLFAVFMIITATQGNNGSVTNFYFLFFKLIEDLVSDLLRV